MASSLVVLKLLSKENYTLSGLATKSDLALSTLSGAVKELEEKGFIQKAGRKIMLNNSPLTHQLKTLLDTHNIEKILRERKEEIIIALTEPLTMKELAEQTKMSQIQIYRHIKEMKEIGAVSREYGKYFLAEKIRAFAEEFKKNLEVRKLEKNAILVFSNKFKLKKLPLNSKANGSLTAFSLFAKYGIEYAIVNDFYVEPTHELEIEEVFIHSLVFSESKKDIAMCLVFYEKNKAKLELRKLVEYSRKFKVLGLLFDCIAYLEKREVKKKERFLPWNEFQAIASNYKVTQKIQNKFSAKELEIIFSEIQNFLEKPLTVFLIGGCNMALHGIKAATKDIDLIVKNKQDFKALDQALKGVGFSQATTIENAYKKMNPSRIFEKKRKPRIDVFTGIVCNALSLSNRIIDRSIQKNYGKLTVNFVRLEDIVLFKAITERQGDLEDIATIIRTQNIDWNFFLEELNKQHENNERLFCLDILDTIWLLEEKEKIVTPIKRKLVDLCTEKAILFLARKPVTVLEVRKKIDFAETTIRNKIQSLVKQGKLKKIKSKPFKVVVT